MKDNSIWNLMNIPPRGHEDVGEFAYELFEIARKEKDRLDVPETAMRNYAAYRGQKQDGNGRSNQQNMTPANLYFANIERTVSNITARDPVGEVVDLDGETDDSEKVLSAKLEKWWKDTNQRQKLRASAKLMEVYGVTIEKPFFDFTRRHDANIELVDMFGFYPAPGLWDDISEDAPYVCFVYRDFVDKIEADFDVVGVREDEAYELLGQEREKYKPAASPDVNSATGRYLTPMSQSSAAGNVTVDRKLEHGLIIEVWIRDHSTKKESVLTLDDEVQDVVEGEVKEPVYPDGIRKITVTLADGVKNKGQNGYIVLDDSSNPNINHKMDKDEAKYTHPWGRLPVYIANSYKDPMSIWGFAAAEQTGYMLYYINHILKKLVNWTKNVMTPPLIIQKHCGITKQMIESDNETAGRLVLMPSIPNARIEFMQIPNLPQSFFIVLDKIIQLHDRIHAIEEADRGVAPSGVIAAAAFVALQEKNQVALQPKTISVESLAENRSKWAIGLWQNWGTDSDMVSVNGQPKEFVGTDYRGRKFNFVVESGSTVPRTSLQVQELTMKLAEAGKISTPYLLETLNLPGWKQEVARTSGPLVEQALSILQDAGAPPEALQQMYALIQEVAMMQEDVIDVRQQVAEGQQKQPAQGGA
jgi:hypothetical protein